MSDKYKPYSLFVPFVPNDFIEPIGMDPMGYDMDILVKCCRFSNAKAQSLIEENEKLKERNEDLSQDLRSQKEFASTDLVKENVILLAENEKLKSAQDNSVVEHVNRLLSLVAVKEENTALKEQLVICDKLIENRNEVLRALECPVHGECVQGALEKIAALRARLEVEKKLADSPSYSGLIHENANLAFKVQQLEKQIADAPMVWGHENNSRIWQLERSVECHNNGLDVYPQEYTAKLIRISKLDDKKVTNE